MKWIVILSVALVLGLTVSLAYVAMTLANDEPTSCQTKTTDGHSKYWLQHNGIPGLDY